MSIAASHSLSKAEDRKVRACVVNGEARITKRNKEKYERTENLIEEVYCDITNGFTKSEIIRKIKLALYEPQQNKQPRDKNFPYEIYNAAMARLKEDADIKKDDMRNMVYGQFLAVYNDAVLIGDRQAALRALENIGKLSGLYDDAKTEINLNSNGPVEIKFGFDN
jgi:hypothetical protein